MAEHPPTRDVEAMRGGGEQRHERRAATRPGKEKSRVHPGGGGEGPPRGETNGSFFGFFALPTESLTAPGALASRARRMAARVVLLRVLSFSRIVAALWRAPKRAAA